jgi:hypothetical protein
VALQHALGEEYEHSQVGRLLDQLEGTRALVLRTCSRTAHVLSRCTHALALDTCSRTGHVLSHYLRPHKSDFY